MTKKTCMIISIWVLLIFFAPVCPAGASGTNGKGMVTDVSGTPKIISEGKTRTIKPMLILEEGDNIITGKNEEVHIILFSAGQKYIIAGNSDVRIEEGRLNAVKGKMEQQKGLVVKLPSNAKIASRKVMSGGIRDGIKPPVFLNPVLNEKLRDSNITFRWMLPEGFTTEEFELMDNSPEHMMDDEGIYKIATTADSLSYPGSGPSLEPGKEYKAVVRAGGIDAYGKEIDEKFEIRFSILDEEDRKLIKDSEEAARESIGKNPEDREPLINLLLLYMSYDMYQDALATGRQLEKEMPGNENLRIIMAHIYRKIGDREKFREYSGEIK